MEATKASEISNETAQTELKVTAQYWERNKQFIFNQIMSSAAFGHKKSKFSLKEIHFLGMPPKAFDFMKSELESLGYKVEYVLERSLNGKREMIISW